MEKSNADVSIVVLVSLKQGRHQLILEFDKRQYEYNGIIFFLSDFNRHHSCKIKVISILNTYTYRLFFTSDRTLRSHFLYVCMSFCLSVCMSHNQIIRLNEKVNLIENLPRIEIKKLGPLLPKCHEFDSQ